MAIYKSVTGKPSKQRIRTLLRGLKIIEVITAEGPVTLNQICKITGFPEMTVHNYLIDIKAIFKNRLQKEKRKRNKQGRYPYVYWLD